MLSDLRRTSRPAGLGGNLRVAGVIQPISAHAWTALPEIGDVVLSDALVMLAQFAATLCGECLAPDVWAAWQAPKSARF